jgi:2-alkyl-3-oxoalkanoate reductase
MNSPKGTSGKRVFVAGASGVIGLPLVRALVAAGHQVTAMTRTPDKQSLLRAAGATPVVADALDAETLRRAVVDAHPTHVIHQLTALPKAGPKRVSDVTATNRLRDEGTKNLIAAAIAAGATRLVGGSVALAGGDPSAVPSGLEEAAVAVRSMESQIIQASRGGKLEGIVLRYGGFYGPGNPMTDDFLERIERGRLFIIRNDRGLLPFIHLDDAVSATVAALDHGVPGSAYDIVDDRAMSFSEVATIAAELMNAPRPRAVPLWLPKLLMPYMTRVLSVRMPLSNAKARAELGWRPAFPTVRDGLSHMLRSKAA